MTGKQVKDTLYIMGVKLGKLAEDMGMTQQNFSAALKSDNVKSQFLEDIARALGKEMTMWYGDTTSVTQNNVAGDNNYNPRAERVQERVSELSAQNAELIRQNGVLTDIIYNLSKK